MLDQHRQLDTTIEVVTPENIAFHYRLAGPFRRLPAFVIDTLFKALIIATLIIGGTMLFGFLGAMLPGLRSLVETLMQSYVSLMLVFMFVIVWFYGGFFEVYWNGQTPGKWIMSIRVLSTNGKPIDAQQAIMRNILREVDLLLPVASLITMSVNNRFQRLGDLLTGTIVVVEERQWLTGIVKLEDPRAVQLAAYLPADIAVNRSLAKSVAAYVDRRRFFSPLRRREIARHLAEPLLQQFGMPADTSHDLLLCALYHRAFIADLGDEADEVESGDATTAISNPFQINTGTSSVVSQVLGR